MNNFSDVPTKTIAEPEALNPLLEPVRIVVEDGFNPLLVDLSQLFGVRGLSFKVAVESYGQVEAYVFQSRELLCLTVGDLAVAGNRVQVAVRGTDARGDSMVHNFAVSLILPTADTMSAA